MASIPKRYFLISLAIAIIYAFFIGYGIEVFHEGKNYEDFCSQRVYEARNQTACTELNGTWQSYPPAMDVKAPQPVQIDPSIQTGSCSNSYSCQEKYENTSLTHDRIVFIVALIGSIVAFIIGTLLSREITSTGLYGGAVLTLLYGTMRYWQHADNLLKFVLLGVALAILIWIAIKKLQDNKGKK